MKTRRSAALLAWVVLLAPGAAFTRHEPPQVILLGTGYPRPDPQRAGPSTAIRTGGRLFLFDVGRGVTQRIWEAGIPLRSIGAVFLTHLHSDHIAGLPDLFASSWMQGRYAPLELYGPPGTEAIAEAMVRFFEADIHIRRDLTEMHPGAGATVRSHALAEGVVYEDGDIRVTAFRVDHQPVEQAFGFRIDSGARKIVISGDTAPSENLIRHARGADVLVHEVYLPRHFDGSKSPEVAARLKAYHTSAEQVGEVAARAGVKLLVLTHLIPADGGQEFVRRARRHFKGRIVVGRDLMRF